MNAQFKTSDDLQEHYWSVIVPMCRKHNAEHATDVKPWECVRLNGGVINCGIEQHPAFICAPEEYTFALAILEGRGVFVGDEIYGKLTGHKFQWDDPAHLEQINYPADVWTCTPPTKKRTFMLNGVELPCPINHDDERYAQGVLLDFCGVNYEFESISDRNLVAKTINDLLTTARDKE